MKQIKHFCDIKNCNKEIKEEIFELSVSSKKMGFCTQQKFVIEVCQECALKIGIVKFDKEQAKPSLSPADELYDIISDLVYDAASNQ